MFKVSNFVNEATKAIEASFVSEEVPALIKVVESLSSKAVHDLIENPGDSDISELKDAGESFENFANVILMMPGLDLSGDESLSIIRIMKAVATFKSICKW